MHEDVSACISAPCNSHKRAHFLYRQTDLLSASNHVSILVRSCAKEAVARPRTFEPTVEASLYADHVPILRPFRSVIAQTERFHRGGWLCNVHQC